MASQLIVYVYSEDFDRICRFYEEALGIAGDRLGPSWCALPTGQSRFAVHRQDPREPQATDPFRVDFVVEHMEAALERCEAAGAVLIRGIQDEAFGRSALLRDPEGRTFTLIEEDLPEA